MKVSSDWRPPRTTVRGSEKVQEILWSNAAKNISGYLSDIAIQQRVLTNRAHHLLPWILPGDLPVAITTDNDST